MGDDFDTYRDEERRTGRLARLDAHYGWNRRANLVSRYRDRDGVWIAYDYDTGPYVIMLFQDVVEAAKYTSRHGFGHVAFWPFGMSLHEGLDWWNEKENETASKAASPDYEHIHFSDSGLAFCANDDKGSIDMNFDARTLCADCLDKFLKTYAPGLME